MRKVRDRGASTNEPPRRPTIAGVAATRPEQNERRGAYRARLAQHEATAYIPDVAKSIAVLDVGADGAGLLLPAGRARLLQPGALIQMRLAGHAEFDATATLVSSRAANDADFVHAGVQFHRMGSEALGALSQFVITRYLADGSGRLRSAPTKSLHVREPGQIQRLLLYHALERGQALRMHGPDGMPLGEFWPVSTYSRDGVVRGLLCQGRPPLNPKEASFEFRLSGSNALHWFVSRVIATDNEMTWAVPFPDALYKGGFRTSHRVSPGQQLLVGLVHPRVTGRSLAKQIHDVSLKGFSFAIDPESDLLFPADRILVDLPNGSLQAEGVIRSLRHSSVGGALLCGVELLRFSHAADEEHWNRLVFTQTFPGVEIGDAFAIEAGDASAIEAAWRVLETSGYLEHETTPAIRRHLRRSFHYVWGQRTPHNTAARFLVAWESKLPIGTICTSLFYPGTWLMHQMGIDADRRRHDRRLKYEICHSMFAGITYLLEQTPDFLHLIVYFDAHKRFNQMLYGDFLRSYPFHDHFHYADVFIRKCDPQLFNISSTADALADPALAVRPATDDDLRIISVHLRQHCSQLEQNALALDYSAITLREMQQDDLPADCRRARRIYVATQHGRLVGCLFAESGPDGLNIFNLYNLLWFVSLPDAPLDTTELKCALVQEALRNYRKIGTREVLFAEHNVSDSTSRALADLPFGPVVHGKRWIAKRSIMPAWLDYLHDLFRSLSTR